MWEPCDLINMRPKYHIETQPGKRCSAGPMANACTVLAPFPPDSQ